jgi:endonuclease/exonuclease/phosphatase family metal-dependent hydrolase
LNAIAPAIQEGTNVILMGDLNATPDQAPIIHLAEFLVNACPEDQAAQGTFNGSKLDGAATGRIDHIWLSPSDWSVQRYSVPQPRVNGRQVSDHYPVVVDLRMR